MVAVAQLTNTGVASLEELLEAQRVHRVIKSERGYEVLRYDDSLQVLRAPRLLRAKLFLWRADNIGLQPGFARSFMERMLNTQEGEQRRHLRTPMARLLAPRSIRKLTEGVHEIVNRLLDEVQDPDDVDLLNEVCWKLPPEVWCLMFSAPRDLAPTVARLSDSLLAPLLTVDSSRLQELEDAHREVFDLVTEFVDERRKNLGDDFTSALIEEEMAGNLTRQELYDTGVGMLEASVDNTVHQGALVLGRLLERPDDWQRLLADREFLPNAVEEVIRMWPRFRTHIRYASEDLDLYGTPVEQDALIFVSVVAAQHDPDIFEDPLEFDITRSVHPGTLVFGQGQYSCIGQHLARLEMHALLQAILDRFPNARLIEPLEEHEGPFVREVIKLRVSLTGR